MTNRPGDLIFLSAMRETNLMIKYGHGALGLAAALSFAAALSLPACQRPTDSPAPERLSPVKPGKDETPPPSASRKDDTQPSIKLKRSKDGSYTWEISGKDIGAVIKADRALDRRLGGHTSKSGPEE